MLNPGTARAHVTATFYDSRGHRLAIEPFSVAGLRRATLRLNDIPRLQGVEGIASVVTADRPIVVERPEYFGSPNAGGIPGSVVFGRIGISPFWIFPGGDTTGKSEFLLLFNPNPRMTTRARITVYQSNRTTASATITLLPHERGTFDVGSRLPGLTSQRGEVVQTTDGQGIVVEQTVFAPNHSTLRSTQGLPK